MGALTNLLSDKKRVVMLTVTVVVVIILLTMTFVVPDRQGQIRQDLQVGDFILFKSTTSHTQKLTITSIDGDNLTVDVLLNGSSSTVEMSKAEFLSKIYFTEEMASRCKIVGDVDVNTITGHRFCTIYSSDMNNTYYVDEYKVIYYSGIGGNFWTLIDTTLIIGNNSDGSFTPAKEVGI